MIVIRNTLSRWAKSFILIALSFVFVAACHQASPQRSNVSTEGSDNVEACRVVQHSLGETCIPYNPQRIVILDEFYLLDNLAALGIKPIGYTPCLQCFSSDVLSEYVTDVPTLGKIETPSLEKILNLKPDLILGLDWQEESYSLLSDIAPTMMMEAAEITGFKEMLKYIAEILGRSDRVEKILTEYEEKVRDFQQKLGGQLASKTISVLRVSGSSFSVNKIENSIYGQVMLDAGIQFADVHASIKNSGYTPVSIETLPDWDADFLFVFKNYERQSEELASLMEHPIWSTLSVVQNGKVHPIVLDVWGPLTAIQFIDDLSQYFSEEL